MDTQTLSHCTWAWVDSFIHYKMVSTTALVTIRYHIKLLQYYWLHSFCCSILNSLFYWTFVWSGGEISWISPLCAKIQACCISTVCIAWYENAFESLPGLSMSDCGGHGRNPVHLCQSREAEFPSSTWNWFSELFGDKVLWKTPKSKYLCTLLSSCEWCKAGNVSPLL